jgi:hypothetical protein
LNASFAYLSLMMSVLNVIIFTLDSEIGVANSFRPRPALEVGEETVI